MTYDAFIKSIASNGSFVERIINILPQFASIMGKLPQIDVKFYDVSGTDWVKPDGAVFTLLALSGGGGGGGSGGTAAVMGEKGAGGGQGAGMHVQLIPSFMLPSVVTPVIGAGGLGSTAGNQAGQAGGTTQFHKWLAVGGLGGAAPGELAPDPKPLARSILNIGAPQATVGGGAGSEGGGLSADTLGSAGFTSLSPGGGGGGAGALTGGFNAGGGNSTTKDFGANLHVDNLVYAPGGSGWKVNGTSSSVVGHLTGAGGGGVGGNGGAGQYGDGGGGGGSAFIDPYNIYSTTFGVGGNGGGGYALVITFCR